MADPIVVADIKQREIQARRAIQQRQSDLEQAQRRDYGYPDIDVDIRLIHQQLHELPLDKRRDYAAAHRVLEAAVKVNKVWADLKQEITDLTVTKIPAATGNAKKLLLTRLDALTSTERVVDDYQRTRVPQVAAPGVAAGAPTAAVILPDVLADVNANLTITVLDPLYHGLQDAFAQFKEVVGPHLEGKFPSQQAVPSIPLTDTERAFAVVYGCLERDGHVPAVGDNTQTDPRFARAVHLARGEYFGNKPLFDAVLPILVHEGNQKGTDVIRCDQWVGVGRTLVERGIGAGDPLLALKVTSVLAALIGVDDSAPPSTVDIDLPDLEDTAEVEIVADNVNATQVIYFSAMLEEARLFQVVDKLAEQFVQGVLPIGRGDAGNFLYGYLKKTADRMSELERRNLYARAFGMPGGDASVPPNREFSDLWLRFVSAVSSFVRQNKVDLLLRSNLPAAVSQEQVRKAGRDLGANLSLHGYGIAYFAGTELQDQVKKFISLLSNADIKSAYGARDMWQVIEQVSALELGGARNTIRYRTMAQAGAVIIRWVAIHAKQLASGSLVDLLNVNEIRNPVPRRPGTKPTTDPSDSDLVNACEQWLAVTGTSDVRVEEYAQPSEGPTMTSRPIQIPSIARDMLDAVGIGLPSNGVVKV
ncbi:MAG TPA: hypothetical protein VGL99_31125 [Chloroflexota bacterium]